MLVTSVAEYDIEEHRDGDYCQCPSLSTTSQVTHGSLARLLKTQSLVTRRQCKDLPKSRTGWLGQNNIEG